MENAVLRLYRVTMNISESIRWAKTAKLNAGLRA